MAFTSSNARMSNADTNNDNWKAQGFLNLYLPGKDGTKRKLGAIPLKQAKPAEKQMLDWLNEDPSRVSAILAKLEIVYQSAAPAETAGFDLSDPVPAKAKTK